MRRLLVLLLALMAAHPGSARAATEISDCSDPAAVRSDIQAGGDYVFSCTGTFVLTAPLVVSGTVSLTAPPNTVAFNGYDTHSTPAPGSADRIFDVAQGGSLTLDGITLAHGYVSAPAVATPNHSHPADGSVACVILYFGFQGGACGPSPQLATDPGQAGFASAAPGGNGGDAPAGTDARGGCLLIEPGGTATLHGVLLSDCQAIGSSDRWLAHTGPYGVPGYQEGLGGFGGEGGHGSAGINGGHETTESGPSCDHQVGHETPGGAGGNGTNGGNGGRGAAGGAGLGGAVFDAGTLTVDTTTFANDRAIGGQGGKGGDGGLGGPGGAGGDGGWHEVFTNCTFQPNSSEYLPGVSGGIAGNGGDGADGGRGGDGLGGAVYVSGHADVRGAAFQGDAARGGAGGVAGTGGGGGLGGKGGAGGDYDGADEGPSFTVSGGTGGQAGNGGDSATSGAGGTGEGGAVFYASGATGTLPDAATTFASDTVLAGAVCAGLGADPDDCGTAAGLAGQGGQGGISTPCSNAKTNCGQVPNAGPGAPGTAGVIGIAGTAQGADVFGTPSGGTSPASSATPTPGASPTPSPHPVTPTPTPSAAAKPHAGKAHQHGGVVTLSVSCATVCSLSADVSSGHSKLGKTSAKLAAGGTKILMLRLNARGRRLIRRHHHLKVTVTVRAGTTIVKRAHLTLKHG